MLDETELFQSGARHFEASLEHPMSFMNGNTMSVWHQPAESNSGLFGGNSNWRDRSCP
jgi:hypothetical protein